jgi:sulfatase maturation enzyme AslB (radical SAM superfamily)
MAGVHLDGAKPATHDRFRGVAGSHGLALRGLRLLREQGVSVQINSTIARQNVDELPHNENRILGTRCIAVQRGSPEPSAFHHPEEEVHS